MPTLTSDDDVKKDRRTPRLSFTRVAILGAVLLLVWAAPWRSCGSCAACPTVPAAHPVVEGVATPRSALPLFLQPSAAEAPAPPAALPTPPPAAPPAALFRDTAYLLAPLLFPQLYKCAPGPAPAGGPTEWASQSHEDEWLESRIFTNASLVAPADSWGGTFIELGAVDGYTYSNTWHFEKTRGWRGLLIEGHPDNQAKLRTNAPTTRPNSVAVTASVCGLGQGGRAAGPGFLSFTKRGGAVGAAVEHAAPEFLKGWHADASEGVNVDCVPLQHLLDATGLHDVDLLSLDVEGAELAVLETLDWGVVNIRIAIIELDAHEPAKDAAVRTLLAREGFVPWPWGSVRDACTTECTVNEVFMNPRYEERKRGGGGRTWTPPYPMPRYNAGTGVRCAQ